MRLALLTLTLTAGGCVCSPGATRGIEEPPRMVSAILGRIPVGTPVDEAQRFMEREGFTCSRCVNDSFPISDSFQRREGLDYIFCDRTDGGLIVSQRWQIAVVHRDGKVVEVLANTGLIGP